MYTKDKAVIFLNLEKITVYNISTFVYNKKAQRMLSFLYGCPPLELIPRFELGTSSLPMVFLP